MFHIKYISISILHWLSKKIIISNFTSMAVCCFPPILVSSFVYIRIKWGETELSRRCMQYNGAILIPIQFFYFISGLGLFDDQSNAPLLLFHRHSPATNQWVGSTARREFGWCRLLLLPPPTFTVSRSNHLNIILGEKCYSNKNRSSESSLGNGL